MSNTRLSLRRFAAVSAVVLLAGASIAAGASVANAVPSAPTITSPVTSLDTVGPDVTISGTLSVPSGYDYLRVQWRMQGSVVDECFQGLAPGDTTFSCTSAVPAPGVYSVVAQHSDAAEPGPGDWSADSNAVTVRVGSIDTAVITNYTSFSNEWSTQSPTISGTGPAFGAVAVDVVYNLFDGNGEQQVPYCTDTVIPPSGEWSCSGTSPGWGYTYFVAYGTTVVGLETVPGSYDDEIGGDMLPPPPDATYVLGPASFQVTLDGLPSWTVFADIFSVATFEGDAYVYGMADEYCPLFSMTPEPGGPTETCFYGDLEPGIWNVYAMQEWEFFTGFYRDDYIMIPEQPGPLAAVVNADRSVRFSGTGRPGYTVIVRDAAENQLCAGVVATGGAWQCTATPAAGTASYRAIQRATGFVATPPDNVGIVSSIAGYSTYTGAVSVTVPPASAVIPPAPTLVEPTPLPWVLEGYDGEPLTPGQRLSLTASGLPVGTEVLVEIRSTPQQLGNVVVGDTGAFALDVVVPTDLEPGDHTIVAIATPPGGIASPVSIPVVVVAAPVIDPVKETAESLGPEKADAAATGDGGSSGGGGVDRADPAAPSAISDSIPTIDRIFRTPLLAVTAGGIALAILLLVAFPAELLNSTLASNTRRLGRWYAVIEGRVERATEWFAAVTRTRALAAAILVVLTALIFGFVDPDYGFDPVSLRMTVSLAIGLFIVTYGASWISGTIIERVWDIPTRVGLQPAALVFAVLGVVVARLLEFSPGFLIGLVIGLDLLTRVGAPHRVRATLTNIGVMVALSVLAWVGFSITSALATGEPTLLGLLVSDALVATTAEGLTAALAALMPLGFLQGHEIFRRSKLLWAGVFGAVAVLFSLIVLPTASGEEGEVADVGFWMLIMVIFAAVTLTLWAVLQYTGRSSADDGESAEQPVGATH